jgi:trans-aconitate 2-methyltransferase
LSLSDEYQQQRAWRPWPRIFAALPGVAGQTVLDLGCGVGDQAAELTARGARVIGIDTNAELLRAARARVPSARFLLADLAALDLGTTVDGLWGSFVAAYFPVLAPVLATWAALLAPGGWVALTEIDDLFAHEPLPPRTASSLEAFATSALARGRHDFTMGRKLRPLLEAAGFCVQQELELEDRELAFQGAASAGVIEAWRARFARMPALQEFCGERFAEVRDDFLACLARDEHRSTARVYCCIARRKQPAG